MKKLSFYKPIKFILIITVITIAIALFLPAKIFAKENDWHFRVATYAPTKEHLIYTAEYSKWKYKTWLKKHTSWGAHTAYWVLRKANQYWYDDSKSAVMALTFNHSDPSSYAYVVEHSELRHSHKTIKDGNRSKLYPKWIIVPSRAGSGATKIVGNVPLAKQMNVTDSHNFNPAEAIPTIKIRGCDTEDINADNIRNADSSTTTDNITEMCETAEDGEKLCGDINIQNKVFKTYVAWKLENQSLTKEQADKVNRIVAIDNYVSSRKFCSAEALHKGTFTLAVKNSEDSSTTLGDGAFIRTNIDFENLLLRVNYDPEKEELETTISPIEPIHNDVIGPSDGTYYPFKLNNVTITNAGSKNIINSKYDVWNKSTVKDLSLVGYGTGTGIHITNVESEKTIHDITNDEKHKNIKFYRTTALNKDPFVTPIKLNNAPNYALYVPIVKEDGIIDGLVIQDTSDLFRINYGICEDDKCEIVKKCENSKCENLIDDDGAAGTIIKETTSSLRNLDLKIVEDIPNNDNFAGVILTHEGSKLNSLTSINKLNPNSDDNATEYEVNCYVANTVIEKDDDDEDVNRIKNINSVCHFPEDIDVEKAFDIVVMKHPTDTLISLEVGYKPTWGDEIQNGSIKALQLKNIAIKSRLPKSLMELGAINSNTQKYKFYGVSIDENGLANHYFKINFIQADETTGRETNLNESYSYPNDTDSDFRILVDVQTKLKGTQSRICNPSENLTIGSSYASCIQNTAENTQNIWAFYNNKTIAHIENLEITEYEENSFNKLSWIQLKELYDQWGRNIHVRVYQDIVERDANALYDILAVGYIENSILELVHCQGCYEGNDIISRQFNALIQDENNDEYPIFLANQKCDVEKSKSLICGGLDKDSDDFYKDCIDKDFYADAIKNHNVSAIQFVSRINSQYPEVSELIINNKFRNVSDDLKLYCKPLYFSEHQNSYIDKKDKLISEWCDDSNLECNYCDPNNYEIVNENGTGCTTCPEGQIVENGQCVGISLPGTPICEGAGPFDSTEDCNCEDIKAFNSDESQFMCIVCEEGQIPDPDNFGSCKTEEDDLSKKITECEASGMIWDTTSGECKINTSNTCPTGVFTYSENPDCVCETGALEIDDEKDLAECTVIDTSISKGESGGCNLTNSSNSIHIILFGFAFIPVLFRRRTTYRPINK